jgi:hypothetical protein
MSKHMSKQPKQTPTGRIAFNDRGQAVWEWLTEDGTYKSDVDTRQVKALQDSADVKLGDAPTPPPASNPYSTADAPRAADKKAPRRTLDDMRKLSEEIKRARDGKKP